MAREREYWLQIETQVCNPWPWGIDRMRPSDAGAGGAPRPRVVVLRRYTANWAQPDDRPLNLWDLTEPDPAPTQSAVTGPVLEAKVADTLIVHVRNMDMRQDVTPSERIHSLHARGVQRDAIHNGVFPLSPPDPKQAGKQGDRIAPGDNFTYRWTCPHRSTAGVWLLNDPAAGASGPLGVLVIRAPGEQEGDAPGRALRGPADTLVRFADVPRPPKRADDLLVFHELPGVGLCINGRQGFGNTPVLVIGDGTRLTLRCLNATTRLLSVHIHGHRWQRGDRWTDSEVLGPGASVSLALLENSAENGGGPGEWWIVAQAGDQTAVASLLTTPGGAVSLRSA